VTDPKGYGRFAFEHRVQDHGPIEHQVYRTGDGAPVLVMHELPGLTTAALNFGRRLAAEGFRVYLPLLFGNPGDSDPRRYHRELCISREFGCLAAGKSAPIVDWLRALVLDISRRDGGAKVGVIGMCLTGAFAIPLLAVPCVTAPVAAQPGVPFSMTFLVFGKLGLGRGDWMKQLNVADADIEVAAARARGDGIPLLAVRFESDRICPRARFDRLELAFRMSMIRRELPDGSIWRRWLSPPHATLTQEFERAPDDPAHPTRDLFSAVVAFLKKQLAAA